MFCHKCGQADQSSETFCRQCGTYLTDPTKPPKKSITPQEHVTANLILSALTIIACFTLSVLLFVNRGFPASTQPLILTTSVLLAAMGIWQIQTFWRTLELRKHFKKRKQPKEPESEEVPATGRLLQEADLENFVPTSVTDHTTRELSETKQRSS